MNSNTIIPLRATDGQLRQRDHRLDFWRGLCLIDMVLVHLVFANVQFGDFLRAWIGSYTRFAAGGFVLISGLSIGVIFLPRVLDPARRRGAQYSLWRRAVYVLGVQYISAFGFIILDLLRGQRASISIWQTLRDIVLLREGGDLLPFYVLMIALSPLILQVLRHRFGWLAIGIASFSLFLWGQWHPWAIAIAVHENFPPVLWQMIFVVGVFAGVALPKYDALRRRIKLLLLCGLAMVFGLLFVSEFSSDFGLRSLNLWMSFTKVPLSDGEALRYLSLTLGLLVATDLIWPILKGFPGINFIKTLGRKSLPVYVAHVWLVEAAGAVAALWWWIGKWQILFAVVCIALLWGFAKFLEITANVPPKRWVAMALELVRGDRRDSVAEAMQ